MKKAVAHCERVMGTAQSYRRLLGVEGGTEKSSLKQQACRPCRKECHAETLVWGGGGKKSSPNGIISMSSGPEEGENLAQEGN